MFETCRQTEIRANHYFRIIFESIRCFNPCRECRYALALLELAEPARNVQAAAEQMEVEGEKATQAPFSLSAEERRATVRLDEASMERLGRAVERAEEAREERARQEQERADANAKEAAPPPRVQSTLTLPTGGLGYKCSVVAMFNKKDPTKKTLPIDRVLKMQVAASRTLEREPKSAADDDGEGPWNVMRVFSRRPKLVVVEVEGVLSLVGLHPRRPNVAEGPIRQVDDFSYFPPPGKFCRRRP